MLCCEMLGTYFCIVEHLRVAAAGSGRGALSDLPQKSRLTYNRKSGITHTKVVSVLENFSV